MPSKIPQAARILTCSAVAFLLTPSNAGALNIYVRAVNAKDAKPISGKIVRLKLCDESLLHCRPGYLEGKTDAGGTVTFDLSEPLPKRFAVLPQFGGGWVQCSPADFLYTELVLRSGVVAVNQCDPNGKTRQQFSAKPGEIILFAKYDFWDRFKHFG